MRIPKEFIKSKRGGYYLHVYNHITSSGPKDYPLSDIIHQDKFFAICRRYLTKYNLEVISIVCMGNHYHMIIYCPEEKMTPQQSEAAYRFFHKNDKYPKTIDLESHETKHVQQFCNDISEYMREIQRAYSFWYNKTCPYDRSGHLWKSRFQSQPIESSAYLWACLKYVEMNPVRAGICPFPEDFLGSTFGRWHASGNHIFEKSFRKHIISLCHDSANVTIDDFKEYMTKEMARYSYSDKMKELLQQLCEIDGVVKSTPWPEDDL